MEVMLWVGDCHIKQCTIYNVNMSNSNLIPYLGCKEDLWVNKGRDARKKGGKRLIISLTLMLIWKSLGRGAAFAMILP